MNTRPAGLQPERTALSWQRTGLAASTITLVTTFDALQLGVAVVAVLAAAAAAGTGIVALLHFPRGVLGEHGRTHAWRPLTRIVILVVVTAALGTTMALVRLLS